MEEEWDIDLKDVEGDMVENPDEDRSRDTSGFMGGRRGGRYRWRFERGGVKEACDMLKSASLLILGEVGVIERSGTVGRGLDGGSCTSISGEVNG